MNAPMVLPPITIRAADLSDPIDRARIDAFVGDHPEGTPFHLPAWSAAVARGCGQKSHYLVAERSEEMIVGVLPLTEVHSPLFGRALVSAGFGVGGGILSEGAGAVALLAQAGWQLAERLSCPTMELRGGAHPGAGWHQDSETYCGFVRDLAEEADAQLLAVPRKQRAEIRKALGNDLVVTTGCHASDAAAHYRVYAESVRNLGTPVFPRGLFTEVLREFGNSADILIVSHGGVPVASVLSLYWNGTVYPYWGGGTAAARALRANDRMYFSLMQHARTRGCTRFDFGRSKVGTGAAAFKKNWGFEAQPLTYFKRARDGEAPREINPLSPKYRLQVAAWQRLPLSVANRLGPWISRGLG